MKTRKALNLYDDYYEMMSDAIRMDAYKSAIQAVVKEGDLVIDLGSGLGILSFFALEAGASHVIAIEKGDSIELAKKVAETHGFTERITFVNQNSKDYEPDRLADVLISETLGSFGVEENTIDFTIDARERLLKPGGKMIPMRLCLVLAPVQDFESAKKADFWKDIKGFDYSSAKEEALSRMSVVDFKEEQLLAEPLLFADINLREIQSPNLEGKLVFKIEHEGRLHGLAGWFEVALTNDIGIWTSPIDPPTHWKQAFFPFPEATDVVKGDYLEVSFRVGPESSHSDNSQVSYDFRCTQISKKTL